MNRTLSATLTAALISLMSLSAQEAGPKVVSTLVPTTYGESRLHRVSSDGKIALFKMPEGTRWGGGGPEGSEDPLISPDGKLIASVRKGALTIGPLDGGKLTTVVSGYRYEQLLITAWSPDGGELIYFLGPPQADDAPPSKITESQHFVFNRKSGKSRKFTPGGSFVGWLPDGTMLVHDGEHGTLKSVPLAPGGVAKVLREDAAGFGQIELSPDGSKIALSSSKPNDTSSGSQLVIMDLPDGKATPLSKPGEWAQYQWPKWSPSGKRTGWLERAGMTDGRPFSVLAVDGKVITKPAEMFDYKWLTDSTLVLIGLDFLAVIDADTGKELGRKPLPKLPE